MDYLSELPSSKIMMYQTKDGRTKIDIYFENETAWMSQKMLAELYQTTPQNITRHIKEIYLQNELDEDSTCKHYLQVQNRKEENHGIYRKIHKIFYSNSN